MKTVHLNLTIIFTIISAILIFVFSPVSYIYTEGFNWIIPILGWIITGVCACAILSAIKSNKKG
jgi:preprotein translocase subunit SecD